MSVIIRQALEQDEPSLSKICLLTADAGNSAEHLHDYPELPGLVYAIPYIKLPTTWGFVLEDQTTNKVVGYILGTKDTRTYESYATEHWWPPLALKYAPDAASKPGDVYYTNLLRNMYTVSEANVQFSPAHLHIDILPEYQRKGLGRKLIGRAVEYLRGEGLEGVWVGLDPRNLAVRVFYEKLGFKQIDGAPDVHQLGLRLADWES
ncbi:hypothetical protein D9611_002390 [Ephemerocybe angulata]|uniref:Uncharacterized protein n=2 Tax=Ephemerocybe angulata TaxID=980116 RepID=A0A8H5C300_9AGAR|nr:hypothetical protein D9611_002390 [Tulosesus angulatus]KAF6762346.1 acyl-CoA N-acyltransferase [Tulosesus angulatus]